MNREIKFRGKLVNNKEWAEGNLCIRIDDTYIITPDETILGKYGRVFKNTIGQYTGLHDKNGKEIYEGDIVYCQTKFGKAKAIIKFIDGKFVAYWDSILTHPQNGHCIACYEINKRFEVIGNIYDNPELLGGEDEC
jgi:uncharacterized phage protein (TIGR01671 family)